MKDKPWTKAEREAEREVLRKTLDTATRTESGKVIIYTILRSASPSGMSRLISPIVINRETGAPINIAWSFDRATTGRRAAEKFNHWANRRTGCGMDMGFDLAYSIAGAAGLGLDAFRHEWL